MRAMKTGSKCGIFAARLNNRSYSETLAARVFTMLRLKLCLCLMVLSCARSRSPKLSGEPTRGVRSHCVAPPNPAADNCAYYGEGEACCGYLMDMMLLVVCQPACDAPWEIIQLGVNPETLEGEQSL